MPADFLKVRDRQVPCVVDRRERPDGAWVAVVSKWDWPWKEEITVANIGVDWSQVGTLTFIVKPEDIMSYENPLMRKDG